MRISLALRALPLLVLASPLDAQSAGGARAPAGVRAPELGEVSGVVRTTEGTPPVPLPFAMVELFVDGVRCAVLADEHGRYLLRGVPAGLQHVRALYVGHLSGQVEVLIPSGGSVAVDLELVRQPVPIPPLAVLAGSIELSAIDPRELRVEAPAWASGEVALRTLVEGAGMAEAGVVRGGAGEGGGGEADPRDVLLMRGSTADLKLVLLDGAPVYTPFHLAGLMPSFDATTMGGAALHVGGAPARYDGGLSYILDLRTRAPRRDGLRGGGSLDLLSGQASLEGPLGARAGVLVAGRALHDGAATLWASGGSPYGYRDGLFRFDLEPADGHRLGVTAFANRKSVFLDLASSLGFSGPDAARWGNEAASLVYRGAAGHTLLDVTAAGSRYRAELPIHPTREEREAGRTEPTLARGESGRLRLAVDASRPSPNGGSSLRFGGSIDRMDVQYGARRLQDALPPGADATSTARVAGGYVDWTWRAAPAFDVRLGLRGDHFSSDDRLRWAPRLALYWSLSDAVLLTLAAGRYHQYTRASDAQVEGTMLQVASGLDGGNGLLAGPSGGLLPVATADHLVLSLDQRLESGVRLGVQGFLKGFSGLPGSGAGPLTSSGLDLRVLREGPSITGWLGYSLAWFWSQDPQGSASSTQFTGRHLLSAGVAGRIAGPFGMDLRVAFSDGLPYTSIDLAAEPATATEGDFTLPTRSEAASGNPALAGGPADGFLRIDAEVHADLLPRWGRRRFALRPYAKVLNALDRRDALFWYFAPWRDPEVQPLAELSLVPIVGLEWRF